MAEIFYRYICRAWRQIALNYTKLSDHIYLTRPECVPDLLDRSGNALLYIYERATFSFGAERATQARRLVLARLDRIVSVQIHFAGLIPELIPLVASAASLNQYRVLSTRFLDLHCHSYPSPLFDSGICAVRGSCLEELTLESLGLTVSQHILVPNLRCFSLSFCLHPSEADEFIAALDRLSGLEVLTLNHLFKLGHTPADH